MKIIETFNTLYDNLTEEFNNGLITVVGSTLNHITGFKTKDSDTGDVDILVHSEAGELALIKTAKYLDTDVKVIYEPNFNYRGLKIWFDGGSQLIEIFRIDPKLGVLTDIEYSGKTYSIYKQSQEDQLNELYNIAISTYNKITSVQEQLKTMVTPKNEERLESYKRKLTKHLATIEYHTEKAGFDVSKLTNYMAFQAVPMASIVS